MSNWYRVQHPFENDMKIMRTDLSEALEFGKQHITSAEKGHAVFDIDDTIIMGDDSVHHAVKELYDNSQLPKSIVTARPERYRKETLEDLAKASVADYTQLDMLSQQHEKDGNIGLFKWQKRHKLESAGRLPLSHEAAPIQLNVGDQWTDHVGLAEVADTLDDIMKNDGVYVLMPLTTDGRKVMAANLSIKLPSLD